MGTGKSSKAILRWFSLPVVVSTVQECVCVCVELRRIGMISSSRVIRFAGIDGHIAYVALFPTPAQPETLLLMMMINKKG